MEEKHVLTLLKKLEISLDQWRLQVLAGKRVLTDIVATVYPADVRDVQQLTQQIATKIDLLKAALHSMEKIVNDIEEINSKMKALEDLNKLSGNKETHLDINKVFVDFQDILCWCRNITSNFKEQLQMNTIIVSEICHLNTRDEALMHQSVWVLQPGVSPECEADISYVRHIVQQESASRVK